MRKQIMKLTQLTGDYNALVEAGEGFLAMGAALALVDIALMIATTPSSNADGWSYKRRFFEDLFPSMAETLRHPHAARVASAAVTAERLLWSQDTSTRH